ncbi:hypothetical protein EB001_17930, partial [bacterium]|nr:hypothetical protein [bacterium]
ITKAHDIAKSVEKNEGEMDEAMTKKHFQHVADTLKQIEDPKKRAEYAKHHSAIFQHSNPRFDHAKFMKAAGVDEMEEGRVKDWLMDLESDANDMTRDEFIKKHGQSQAHVWDKVNKENKENEGKEMKKDKMNESVVIATDNPAEAAMMMQLLKLAGVQPISQDMINQPSAEVQADETYANTPKEKYSDIKAAVPNGTDLNREKGAYVKAAGGDNPMAIKMGEAEITEEYLSNSLRAQYESFKQTYQEAAKAKPDFLDVDKDGNKTEPMKQALKDKEGK